MNVTAQYSQLINTPLKNWGLGWKTQETSSRNSCSQKQLCAWVAVFQFHFSSLLHLNLWAVRICHKRKSSIYELSWFQCSYLGNNVLVRIRISGLSNSVLQWLYFQHCKYKLAKKSKQQNTWIDVFYSGTPANILQLKRDNKYKTKWQQQFLYPPQKVRLLIIKASITKTISFVGVLPFWHKFWSYSYRMFAFPM